MATVLGGFDIVILVGGAAVGGQRDFSINRLHTTIDTTTKADYPDRTKGAGWNDSNVSLDAAYVASEAGYVALLAAYTGQTSVTLSEQEDGSVIFTATALVTNITKNAPMDSETTYSISLEISGGWTAA